MKNPTEPTTNAPREAGATAEDRIANAHDAHCESMRAYNTARDDSAIRSELTFDGCGINGPDEYRSRLCTFNYMQMPDETLAHYGAMFAAAPETAARLAQVEAELSERAGIERALSRKLRLAEAKLVQVEAQRDSLLAALRKVERDCLAYDGDKLEAHPIAFACLRDARAAIASAEEGKRD